MRKCQLFYDVQHKQVISKNTFEVVSSEVVFSGKIRFSSGELLEIGEFKSQEQLDKAFNEYLANNPDVQPLCQRIVTMQGLGGGIGCGK